MTRQNILAIFYASLLILLGVLLILNRMNNPAPTIHERLVFVLPGGGRYECDPKYIHIYRNVAVGTYINIDTALVPVSGKVTEVMLNQFGDDITEYIYLDEK